MFFTKKGKNGRYSQKIYSSLGKWSNRERIMQAIQYMQKYRLKPDQIVFADKKT
jgi:hypothetical protein